RERDRERDRRHNTFGSGGSGSYHHHASHGYNYHPGQAGGPAPIPPARSSTPRGSDWRPSSYVPQRLSPSPSSLGANRAATMSPDGRHAQPGPFSSSGEGHRGGGGSTNPRRAGGVGSAGGSRGGSPLRK
ncbi:hypothetical protein FB639_005184, partial [Coemansia asiatica]